MEFPLSQKYIDFLNTTDIRADILEGTTASGKTTVGAVKFMRMVSKSKRKLHLIASRSVGIAEKNIIQQDNGILSIFPTAIYYGNGTRDYRMPHIQFEDKVIFIIGYDSKEKWQMVLGSQFGCIFIDEINIAHMDLLREVSTRNEYMLATLNPDDPTLPVFKEFINRSRPYNKYKDDIPESILKELKEPEVKGWKYWFFSFNDNASLSKEEIERKKQSAPPGTKLYKNKIEGVRCKAAGLVFSNFSDKHIISIKDAKAQDYRTLVIGVDTAYSQQSPDTIAMLLLGITKDRKLYVLEERIYNNATLREPLAPSDVVKEIIGFADYCRIKYKDFRYIYIDSADQATITECNKYKKQYGSIYNFINAYKKMKVIDRINLQLGWLATDNFYVVEHCKEYIHELNTYSWTEDGQPEDGNDHTINAVQYGFLPYVGEIG